MAYCHYDIKNCRYGVPPPRTVWAEVNPSMQVTDLRVLLVGAVDNGRAADLGDLLSVSVVRPAADLLTANHVFDENNATVETQRQLVKQLDVLQQVVVRVTAGDTST